MLAVLPFCNKASWLIGGETQQANENANSMCARSYALIISYQSLSELKKLCANAWKRDKVQAMANSSATAQETSFQTFTARYAYSFLRVATRSSTRITRKVIYVCSEVEE